MGSRSSSALDGGECDFYVCVPSKALLRPGEALAEVLRGEEVQVRLGVLAATVAREGGGCLVTLQDGEELGAERPGFLALIGDGERLIGAHALGPDVGEWMQQATLAIRAAVPLAVMRDTIQPFPTFSEVFRFALEELDA